MLMVRRVSLTEEKLGNMQQLFMTNAKFSGKIVLDFIWK